MTQCTSCWNTFKVTWNIPNNYTWKSTSYKRKHITFKLWVASAMITPAVSSLKRTIRLRYKHSLYLKYCDQIAFDSSGTKRQKWHLKEAKDIQRWMLQCDATLRKYLTLYRENGYLLTRLYQLSKIVLKYRPWTSVNSTKQL